MRAKRVDANQADVVRTLRKVGCSVYSIGQPVDLLVGFRGRSLLLEVKSPGGRLTDAQRHFFANYKGEAYIVNDVQQAVKAVLGK